MFYLYVFNCLVQLITFLNFLIVSIDEPGPYVCGCLSACECKLEPGEPGFKPAVVVNNLRKVGFHN